MKNGFLYILFSLFVTDLIGQTIISTKIEKTNLSESDKWGLNKYIWSHANYKSGKNNKLVLDFDAMDNWVSLSDKEKTVAISPNGKYFTYGVQHGVDYSNALDSIVVQETYNSWHIALPGIESGFFSADNKQYVFPDTDRLCLLQVGSDKREYINGVESYKLPDEQTSNSKNEWLAYQIKNKEVILRNLVSGYEKHKINVASYNFDASHQWLACKLSNSDNELFLYNLRTGKEKTFAEVKSYQISENGNSILLNTPEGLRIADLATEKLSILWSVKDTLSVLTSFVFDASATQVAFFVNHCKVYDDNIPDNSIWYWKEGMEKAEMKANNQSMGINADLFITGFLSFSDNNNYILFNLQNRPNERSPLTENVKLAIWDYTDTILQSKQSYKLKEQKRNLAILNIKNNKIIQLRGKYKAMKGDYAIVATAGMEKFGDRFWENGFEKDSNWLVSLRDGLRQLLPTTIQNDKLWFSPTGHYLVYFDADQQCNYFSFNLQTGKLVNISAQVPAWQLGNFLGTYKFKQPQYAAGGLVGWAENDEGIFVYDDFDIWKLDLSGKKPAANITNGYGRLHEIQFGLVDKSRSENNDKVLPKECLLRAFNIRNKQFGFYRKKFDLAGNPELLFMDECTMWTEAHAEVWTALLPLKAPDSNTWILKRQSAKEPMNFYLTEEFRNFKPLTNIQSQKQINWLTRELHSYKQLDGMTNYGILYKPENFDPNKKYPVAIIFYDQFTDNLNRFSDPEYNVCAVSFGWNPGWLVSHGYLVFTPDINVTPLKYGPSAYNVIEGAASYLKQLPYVDGNHIGAGAHSWSAKLGSYVYTHSKSFAAMTISEGFVYTNPINVALSLAGGMGENGKSQLEGVEKGFQYGNLWENKNSWLDQTAVFNADKAINPLLLFCNRESSAEYQNQTLQLYTALRRLEKKTWWLEYDNGGHTVSGNEARDYTIRFTQYFDHYLKEAPAPRWMTQGLPYKLKGVEHRFELDAAGSCAIPGKNHCYVCEAWNKQYKRNPSMFEKEIKDWALDKDIKAELDKKTSEERKKLDKEGAVMNKKIVEILKNGYPEDKRSRT